MELTHVNQLSQTKVRLINNYNNDGILLDHDSYPKGSYNTDLFYYNNYWYLLDTGLHFTSGRRLAITKITDKDLELLYTGDDSVNYLYEHFLCKYCSDLVIIYKLENGNYLTFETIVLKKDLINYIDLNIVETYSIVEDSNHTPYSEVLHKMKEIENKYDRKYFKH